MIILIVLIVRIIAACGLTYVSPFKLCLKSVVVVDMNEFEAVHIDGIIKNDLAINFSCFYRIVQSQIFMVEMLGSKLQAFKVYSGERQVALMRLLVTDQTSEFFVKSAFSIDPLVLMGIMRDRNVSTTVSFRLQVTIPPHSVVLLKMQFFNIYHCSRFLAEVFDCGNTNNFSRLCISRSLVCDGFENCPFNGTDESTLCTKKTNYTIGVSLMMMVLMIFLIVAWFLFRTISCIGPNFQGHLEMNMLSLASHLGSTRDRHDRTSIMTPDNMSPPPPKFLSISRHPDHQAMPPSYSRGSLPGVYPDFFKRFFGTSLSVTRSTRLTRSTLSDERVPLAASL